VYTGGVPQPPLGTGQLLTCGGMAYASVSAVGAGVRLLVCALDHIDPWGRFFVEGW
jgi:hypothetical protein